MKNLKYILLISKKKLLEFSHTSNFFFINKQKQVKSWKHKRAISYVDLLKN